MKLEFYHSDTILELLQFYEERRRQDSKRVIEPKILRDIAKALGGKKYNDFAQVKEEVCHRIRQSSEKSLEKVSHQVALFLVRRTAELTLEKSESMDPKSQFKEHLDSVKIEIWKTPLRSFRTNYLDEAIEKLEEFIKQNPHFEDTPDYKETIQEAHHEVDHCDLERALVYINLGGSNFSCGYEASKLLVDRIEKGIADLIKLIEQRPHLKNNKVYQKQIKKEIQKHSDLQKNPPWIDKELLKRLKAIAEQISTMAS